MPASTTKSAAKLVAHLDKLPSLPDVVEDLRREVRSEKCSSRSVAHLLERDPPIAAHVLRLANSGLHCRGAKASNLQEAVSRVGLREVENVVMAASVAQVFGVENAGVRMDALYSHAILSTVAAECIQDRKRGWFKRKQSSLFLHALLHDIGLFVLTHFIPDTVGQIANRAASEGRPLSDVEQEVLGYSHDEVGALLLQRWRLPPSVVDSARWHHYPEDTDSEFIDEICTVAVADHVAVVVSDSASTKTLAPDCSIAARVRLELTEADLAELVKETQTKSTQAAAA